MQSWFTNLDRSSSSSPANYSGDGNSSSAEAGHANKQSSAATSSGETLDETGEKTGDSLSEEADRSTSSSSSMNAVVTDTTNLLTSSARAKTTGEEFSSSSTSDLNTIVTEEIAIHSERSSTTSASASSESISQLEDADDDDDAFKRSSQDKLLRNSLVSSAAAAILPSRMVKGLLTTTITTTSTSTSTSESTVDADSRLQAGSGGGGGGGGGGELIRTKRVIYSMKLFYFLDVMLAIAFFSPMVGIYWYCSWSFLDKYFLSGDGEDEHQTLSSFLSYAIGLLVLLPSYLFQQDIKRCYNFFKRFGRVGTLMRFTFRNLYLYMISFAFVFQWRGLWNICETYLFEDLFRQMALAIAAILFFCLAGSTGSLVSTPFILYRDDLNDPFTSESRFKFKSISPYLQYLIDFVLGELIECFVLVLAWRGVGNAFDRYIFPKETGTSVICSFTVSHLVFLLIAFTEYKLVERTLRMSTLPLRLAIENFFNLVMFLSCVLIWKFYWDLIDNYLLSPNYELLIFAVGHFAAFVVSILFNVTFLLAGPGTSIMDGEQTKRETNIYFKINYLSAMFKKRAKRLQRRQMRNESV